MQGLWCGHKFFKIAIGFFKTHMFSNCACGTTVIVTIQLCSDPSEGRYRLESTLKRGAPESASQWQNRFWTNTRVLFQLLIHQFCCYIRLRTDPFNCLFACGAGSREKPPQSAITSLQQCLLSFSLMKFFLSKNDQEVAYNRSQRFSRLNIP